MSAKTTLKSIDAAEFDALASQTRLTEGPRAMARMVLVDRKSGPEVASLFNVSKQRVSLAVGSIRKAYEANSTLVGIPSGMTGHMHEFLIALRNSKSSEVQELAMTHVNKSLRKAAELLTLGGTE